MQKTLPLAAMLFVLLTLSGCAHEKPDELPNIIVILADDLGYGDVAFLNPDSKIPTPNLNRMAGEGLSFTNAHAPASVCTPSRYSMLTGRYPWRSRLKQGVLWIWDRPLIQQHEFTIGEMLQEQGYHTACIGKWHLGWDWPTTDGQPATLDNEGRNVDYARPIMNGPVSTGFDYYFGDDVPSFPPHAFIENERLTVMPSAWNENGPGAPGAMAPGWTYEALLPALSEKAEDYIRERVSTGSGQPFFLFFSMNAPHTPIAPSAEFIGKSGAGRYGDFVVQVDHSVGRILKLLREQGIDENTLVLFSSDNGAVPFDGTNYTGRFGSIYDYGHNPNGKLRGVKSDAWEGGHREPFIAWWPGRIRPGTSGALVSQTDLMATFAELTNFGLPDTVAADSYSMLTLLLGKDDRAKRGSLIKQSGNGILSIQQGKWKLIMSSGSGGSWSKPKGTLPVADTSGETVAWKNVQLYNLEDDLSEQHNVAEQNPEITADLAVLLAEQISKGRSTDGPILRNDGPETWKQVEWMNVLK